MRRVMSDVEAFNAACSVPMRRTPGLCAPDELALARKLIYEEVVEELLPTIDALAAGEDISDNLVALADACIDSVYVIAGLMLRLGIPGHIVWDIVQTTNMAKIDAETGAVRRREDGKILKPDGWVPPEAEIAALFARMAKEA